MAFVEMSGLQPCQRGPTSSRGNYCTFNFVVEIMVPAFIEMFGDDTHENVLVMSPYKKRIELYNAWTAHQILNGTHDRSQLPKFSTVDSTVGVQAAHVIVDLVVDGTDRGQVGLLNGQDNIIVTHSSVPVGPLPTAIIPPSLQ
jgi:hypothetical protein